MISNQIYLYFIIFTIIISLIISAYIYFNYIFNEKNKILFIWFVIIFELNLLHLFIILFFYEKKLNNVGIQGLKGDSGLKGPTRKNIKNDNNSLNNFLKYLCETKYNGKYFNNYCYNKDCSELKSNCTDNCCNNSNNDCFNQNKSPCNFNNNLKNTEIKDNYRTITDELKCIIKKWLKYILRNNDNIPLVNDSTEHTNLNCNIGHTFLNDYFLTNNYFEQFLVETNLNKKNKINPLKTISQQTNFNCINNNIDNPFFWGKDLCNKTKCLS